MLPQKFKFIKTNLNVIERPFYLNLNDEVGNSEAFATKKIFLFMYQRLKKLFENKKLLFDKDSRVHIMIHVSLKI